MRAISIYTRLLALSFAVFVLTSTLAKGDSIAFFYALDADVQGLKTLAREMGQSAKVGSRSIQRLQLGTHTIYAVKMGAGAVETAVSAQALLARNRCDWAFSLGPAGALADTVVTDCWYRVGRIVAWQHGSSASASPSDFPAWDTDWSRLPATNIPPPLGTASNLTVASGEQFISTTEDRDRLQALSQADAVDMNGYGLTVVCADHGVPLFSWKVVSDQADEEAAETFRAFIASYSGAGGKALAEIIQSLPPNPNDPSSYPAIEKALRETGAE
ncbi:MAG: hypothetical protein AB7V22_01320 [Kiritimatiellia bacterium]